MGEKAGFYQGKHYTEWVETAKQLKRENRLEEAIVLLEGLVDATESEARVEHWAVSPWYYNELAIIHRKQKNPEAEVAILKRFEAAPQGRDAVHPGMAARLRKAQELLAKASGEFGPADKAAARHREAYLRRANQIGCPDREFEAETRRLGEADPAEVFMSLARRRIHTATADGEWLAVRSAWREVAEHLAETGQPWLAASRSRVLAELRAMPYTKSDAIVRLGASCKCEVCQADDRRRSTYAEALRDESLPHAACEKPPCRCWWYESRTPGEPYTIEVEIPLRQEVTVQSEPGRFKRFLRRRPGPRMSK